LSPLSPARATAIVDAFGSRRVLVLGDVMLDHFVLGRVHRVSPEAPVPVVTHSGDEYRLGGAANVAANVRSLGGRATLVGVVGADERAARLRAALASIGLDDRTLVVDRARPTTCKVRVITERRQQVARIDYETDVDIAGEVAAAVRATVMAELERCHIVVVSDYLKGVVADALMPDVIARARSRGLAVLVDPKIPHLSRYRGATLVTPNHLEAERATDLRVRTDEEARAAARAFRLRARCQSVLITRGEHGMWLLDGSGAAPDDATARPDAAAELSLRALAREVADVTGAGDTVVATLALACAAGGTLAEAADLANHGAGLVVAKFGPATISTAELLADLHRSAG
jgi:D-beta-D-heptose 7-phosphate kinase/D-beta-D-heptose 1-phosphate adenosyltransferase